MEKEFEPVVQGVLALLEEWEPKLLKLPTDVISQRRNVQYRTIKQIVGHMIDSVSNNTHRIVHMQYQQSPLIFPDYANLGNNERWITIQNYQSEDWNTLIQLWKYYNIHIVHVIKNVNSDKLDNEWTTALGKNVTLKNMIFDYLRHFKLHLNEIDELINSRLFSIKT
jgi:hypothetical protein